jgi:curved DNA-binding protein CbpA
MSQRTYYEILGLTSSCTAQEIRKSYRQLALLWHPDKHTNKEEAQEEFMFINEAYNILSDVKKRTIYDTCGQRGLDMNQDIEDFANNNTQNFFYQKGFQGTEKSAFDVLRDIFQENEDDSFFKDCNMPGMADTYTSTIKSFFNENVIFSEDEGNNFLGSYEPTFLNAEFSSQFTPFNGFCSEEGCFAQFFESISASGTCAQDFSEFSFKDSRKPKNSNLPSRKKTAAKSQKRQKKSFLVNDGCDERGMDSEIGKINLNSKKISKIKVF